MQSLPEDETPRSPTHKQVNAGKEPSLKLKQLLHGTKLEDLALDFISTRYFSDLYLLDGILGAGSFGVVLKIVERGTGQELALKVRCFFVFWKPFKTEKISCCQNVICHLWNLMPT